jgi:hypothetical protein
MIIEIISRLSLQFRKFVSELVNYISINIILVLKIIFLVSIEVHRTLNQILIIVLKNKAIKKV